MTSTNDGKDVKINQTSGPKGKSHFIELYKSLDANLNGDCDLSARTAHLSEAWRRVYSLCAHSAPSTHPHLLAWIQRHTSRAILQTEWQSPSSKELHDTLDRAIKEHTQEVEDAIVGRGKQCLLWESQLLERAVWFRSVLDSPWDHPVLKVLLDPKHKPPSDQEVLEWLQEERGITFMTRLRQLALSKGCDDLALSLASAVLDRVRAASRVVPDPEQLEDKREKPPESEWGAFERSLRTEAGFSQDVLDFLTDVELVMLHKRDKDPQCIHLAKSTPLRLGHTLVERLASRLELAPRDKKIWKNSREVAIIVAQVIIARCMMVPLCVGTVRTALYWCGRSVARLVRRDRLPKVASALAAPAATARHLHTLAAAHHAQLADSEEQRGFVCELYIRAITTGMNELEKLKGETTPDKMKEARQMEQTLATWFIQLGTLLSSSARVRCECNLTAFSVHPSPAMFERIKLSPPLPTLTVEPQETENKEQPNSDFGSWASDSRQQTNFVKTSETLNLKVSQVSPKMANVLSTAIFTEGEGLGLTPELSNDLAVLLSGPRVKTLSWDMERELLLENCRLYMQRTSFGTRALTTELRYLNLDPKTYQHLPEEEDGEDDVYYGIEKGYEHLVEFEPQPEEIWQDAYSDPDKIYSAESDIEDRDYGKASSSRKKKRNKRLSESDTDPLSIIAENKKEEKKKERPHSKERSKEPKKKGKPKDRVKIKPKEPKTKEKKNRRKKGQPKVEPHDYLNLKQLLGVKVGGTSFEEEFRNSLRVDRDTPVDKENPVTDSDYDSQGKSSFHSEGTEPEAARDPSFPIDELIKTLQSREQVKESITKMLQFRKQKHDEAKKAEQDKAKTSGIPNKLETLQPNLSSLVGSKIINRETQSTQPKSATDSRSLLSDKSTDKKTYSKAQSNKLVNPKKSMPSTSDANQKKTKQRKKATEMQVNNSPDLSKNLPSTTQLGPDSSPIFPLKSSIPVTPSTTKSNLYFDTHQNSYQRFLMELQETKRLALATSNKRESLKTQKKSQTNVTPAVSKKSETATSQSAKPSQQKIENAPNTFARRNYKHKTNKQVAQHQESLKLSIDREIDERIANLTLNKMKLLQSQNLSISRVPNTKEEIPRESPKVEIQMVEKPTPSSNLSGGHPVLSNLLEENVKIASNPTYVNEEPTSTQTEQTKSAPSLYSSLSQQDQEDVLHLLMQRNKLSSKVETQNVNTPSIPITKDKETPAASILRIQNELMISSPIQPPALKIPNIKPQSTALKIPDIIPQSTVIQTANMVQYPKASTKRKPKVKHCQKKDKTDLQSKTAKTLLINSQRQKMTKDTKQVAALSLSVGNHILQSPALNFNTQSPKNRANQTATVTNNSQNSEMLATAGVNNRPVAAILRKNNKPSQNWTTVMDKLRNLKNPSRGPNAIDLILGRDAQENNTSNTQANNTTCVQANNTTCVQANNTSGVQTIKTTGVLRQQRIIKSDSRPKSLERPHPSSEVHTHVRPVVSQKLPTSAAPANSNKSIPKVKSSKPRKPRAKVTYFNPPVEVLEVKKPTIQYPKKEPIGSGIPHSDYEMMLGELFDADLLQEIDESPVQLTRQNEPKNYVEQTKKTPTTVNQVASKEKPRILSNVAISPGTPLSPEIINALAKNVSKTIPVKLTDVVTPVRNLKATPPQQTNPPKNLNASPMSNAGTPPAVKGTVPNNLLFIGPDSFTVKIISNVNPSPAATMESKNLYPQPQCVAQGGPILITVPRNTQSPSVVTSRTSQNIAFEEIISSSTSIPSRVKQAPSGQMQKKQNIKSPANTINAIKQRSVIVTPKNNVHSTLDTTGGSQFINKEACLVSNNTTKQPTKKVPNDFEQNRNLNSGCVNKVLPEVLMEKLNIPINKGTMENTGQLDVKIPKQNVVDKTTENIALDVKMPKQNPENPVKKTTEITDQLEVIILKQNQDNLVKQTTEKDKHVVEIAKQNQEKLNKKRLSIISRQTEYRCHSSPIALPYAPIISEPSVAKQVIETTKIIKSDSTLIENFNIGVLHEQSLKKRIENKNRQSCFRTNSHSTSLFTNNGASKHVEETEDKKPFKNDADIAIKSLIGVTVQHPQNNMTKANENLIVNDTMKTGEESKEKLTKEETSKTPNNSDIQEETGATEATASSKIKTDALKAESLANNGASKHIEKTEDKKSKDFQNEDISIKSLIGVTVQHPQNNMTKVNENLIVNDTMTTGEDSKEKLTKEVTCETPNNFEIQEETGAIKSTASSKIKTDASKAESLAPLRVSKRIQSRKIKKVQVNAMEAISDENAAHEQVKSIEALETMTGDVDDSMISKQISNLKVIENDPIIDKNTPTTLTTLSSSMSSIGNSLNADSNASTSVDNVVIPADKQTHIVLSINEPGKLVEDVPSISKTELEFTKLVNEIKTTIDVITKSTIDVIAESNAEALVKDQSFEKPSCPGDTVPKEVSEKKLMKESLTRLAEKIAVTELSDSLMPHTADVIKSNETEVVKVSGVLSNKNNANTVEKLLTQQNKIQLCDVRAKAIDKNNVTLNKIPDVDQRNESKNNIPKPNSNLVSHSNSDNKCEETNTVDLGKDSNTELQGNNIDDKTSKKSKTCNIPQMYKNSIQFTEIPQDDTNPLKKAVRITMPDNRVYKATVYGKVHVSFDTLFEVPALKNILLSGLHSKKLYNVNIRNSEIPVVAKMKKNDDTINLISDDEEDAVPIKSEDDKSTPYFLTEFGKYVVKSLDKEIHKKHQSKFSQKCLLKLQRCDYLPLPAERTLNTKSFLCEEKLEEPSSSEKGEMKETPMKIPEVIDIDDSSSDSDCVPVDVRKVNIDEFKHLLLKDYRDILTPENDQRIKKCKLSPSSSDKTHSTELQVQESSVNNTADRESVEHVEKPYECENITFDQINDHSLDIEDLSIVCENFDDNRCSPVIEICQTLSSFMDFDKTLEDRDMISVKVADDVTKLTEREMKLTKAAPLFCDTDWFTTKQTFHQLTSWLNIDLKPEIPTDVNKQLDEDLTDCEDMSLEDSDSKTTVDEVMTSVEEFQLMDLQIEFKHQAASLCCDTEWFVTKRLFKSITSEVVKEPRPEKLTMANNKVVEPMAYEDISPANLDGETTVAKGDVSKTMDQVESERQLVSLYCDTEWFVTKQQLNKVTSLVAKHVKPEKSTMADNKVDESMGRESKKQLFPLCCNSEWLLTKQKLNSITSIVLKDLTPEEPNITDDILNESMDYEEHSLEDSDSESPMKTANATEFVDRVTSKKQLAPFSCDSEWFVTKKKHNKITSLVAEDMTPEEPTITDNKLNESMDYEYHSLEDSDDEIPMKTADATKFVDRVTSEKQLAPFCCYSEWFVTKRKHNKITSLLAEDMPSEEPTITDNELNESMDYRDHSIKDSDGESLVKTAYCMEYINHVTSEKSLVPLCCDSEWFVTKRKHHKMTSLVDIAIEPEEYTIAENKLNECMYDDLKLKECMEHDNLIEKPLEEEILVEKAENVTESVDQEIEFQKKMVPLCCDTDWYATKRKLNKLISRVNKDAISKISTKDLKLDDSTEHLVTLKSSDLKDKITKSVPSNVSSLNSIIVQYFSVNPVVHDLKSVSSKKVQYPVLSSPTLKRKSTVSLTNKFNKISRRRADPSIKLRNNIVTKSTDKLKETTPCVESSRGNKEEMKDSCSQPVHDELIGEIVSVLDEIIVTIVSAETRTMIPSEDKNEATTVQINNDDYTTADNCNDFTNITSVDQLSADCHAENNNIGGTKCEKDSESFYENVNHDNTQNDDDYQAASSEFVFNVELDNNSTFSDQIEEETSNSLLVASNDLKLDLSNENIDWVDHESLINGDSDKSARSDNVSESTDIEVTSQIYECDQNVAQPDMMVYCYTSIANATCVEVVKTDHIKNVEIDIQDNILPINDDQCSIKDEELTVKHSEITEKYDRSYLNNNTSHKSSITPVPEDVPVIADNEDRVDLEYADNIEELKDIEDELPEDERAAENCDTENYEGLAVKEKPPENEASHLETPPLSEIVKDESLVGPETGAENKENTTILEVQKSIQEVNFDDSILAKNATLIYRDDTGVVLKGIEYEDPVMGTYYVFPLVKSPDSSELLDDSYESIIEVIKDTENSNSETVESENASENAKWITPDFPDESSYEKFKQKAPKVYSKKNRKRKSVTLADLMLIGKRPRRSRSRDCDCYGKKKHIDARKISASALNEMSYEKDFQRLIDYYSTQDFSYSLSYDWEHIETTALLKRWPIKNTIDTKLKGEIEHVELFTDIDQMPYEPEVHKLTLAEEISGSKSTVVEAKTETADLNFSMGFGEGSGRVILDLKKLGAYSKFSAVTLSDVKHYQPVLLSERDGESINDTFICSSQEEHEGVQRFMRNLQLRKKVQLFFQTTAKELNNELLCEKSKDYLPLHNNDDKFPFEAYTKGGLVPSAVNMVVQVVQVGQLPVSAAAQNPVTCDPRVTHVSDASPSQCSVDNSSPSDTEQGMKTEYTELTTANLSMPIIGQEYEQPIESKNLEPSCERITIESSLIKSEIMIELEEETPEETEYDNEAQDEFKSKDKEIFNNTDYSFETTENNSPAQSESNVQSQFDSSHAEENAVTSEQNQLNGMPEKTNQIAHAMNAAGITADEDTNTEHRNQALVNLLTQTICQNNVSTTQNSTNVYPKTTSINAISLQQALAQILPQSLNQTAENNQRGLNSVTPQVVHIVHGKNASGNITLVDNSQQSVINSSNAAPVLHIVQNKATNGCPSSNGAPVQQQNTFSGLSLVDTGLQQGGNQLLHIVNTGNQKNPNSGQLLKRVNLLTNVQGSNEQKMLQFLCKSADGKSIQLNAPHQRSMVLRLQPIETTNVQTPPQKPSENQDVSPTSTNANTSPNNDNNASQQEIKSRSVYEENYAKFIQNSSGTPGLEKSTSLPKFNQAFGKPVFEDGNEKESEMNSNDVHLPSVNPENENGMCENSENAINLDHITSMTNPPLLLRKSPAQVSQAQANLLQQIKQTIAPMNIQTMHGGVIYTRQIPVNIGGGQTFNLISVPSSELMDESGQKQSEVKFVNQGDIEPSIIKIVPQTQAPPNAEVPQEDGNVTLQNEGQNSQPQPVLTQMRIRLPMLSKNPQMIAGARVVRPFFQIQRNVIGGANQPVYQQLVLTTASPLGQQTIRLQQPQAQARQSKAPENQSPSESEMSSSTLEQLREFDMVLEQVKERSTVQPGTSSSNTFILNAPPKDSTDSPVSTASASAETTKVLYSIGGNQPLSVTYGTRKSTVTTSITSNYTRSPDSSGVADSSSSSKPGQMHTVTTETAQTNQKESTSTPPKPAAKVHSKSKSKSKSSSHSSNTVKVNTVTAPKPAQKPLEDEQTTQRILYILAEYKEQVENSPDKDKPAPRRRSNPPSNPGSSRRKKSRRSATRDVSPVQGEDTCRTMGSEDSSCGTSQGDCAESCFDTNSPQSSPRKVIRKLTFDQDSTSQPKPQPPRNVIVADGQTITVARGTAGKPATAVIMPANYLLPVSMVKGGQQIAIVTNQGPKILTVTGGESPTANALLLQRLIGPAGLKPVLTRPGIRHVRLPAAALQRIQAFNLASAAAATATPSAPQSAQPPDSTASTAPEPAPPEPDLAEPQAQASSSPPWADRESEAAKPDRPATPEGTEPWNIPSSADPHEYNYDETRNDNLQRTVLEAIPDRYSPDMEAHRIFDKMFDVESKKCLVDSPQCGYDIDASDCEDKTYQVVQKKDTSAARQHRLAHVSALALRHKYAILEHELRLQKSLSEECEDLGVDSPSASDLFPEAELLFSGSPAAQDHGNDHQAHHGNDHQAHHGNDHQVHHGNDHQAHGNDHQAHGNDHQPQHANIPQPPVMNEPIQDHMEDQISPELMTRDRVMDLGLGDEIPVTDQGIPVALDHEEFARSHPNTTFHSEPTDDGEVQPFTLSGLKARHITSTIFHPNRTSTTVLMTAPQATVISPNENVDHVKYSGMDMMHLPQHSNLNLNSVLVKDDGLTRYDSILTDTRELHLSNTASAIVHSGNTTQVIRRVCYEDDKRERERFLIDEPESIIAGKDAKMVAEDNSRDATLDSLPGDVDDGRSSPERPELFWESNSASERSESRRPLDFSSDSEKCCKSPLYDENNSTDSSVGTQMRLDSVIKEARGVERSFSAEGSSADDTHPPLRTYPPKRSHHVETQDRSLSGKTRAGEGHQSPDNVRRRASNRGVVKRGCHCCNGSPAPPRPKKPRQKKPQLDSTNNH